MRVVRVGGDFGFYEGTVEHDAGGWFDRLICRLRGDDPPTYEEDYVSETSVLWYRVSDSQPAPYSVGSALYSAVKVAQIMAKRP